MSPTIESGEQRHDEEGERIKAALWFAQQMLAKLRLKADKGSWHDCSINYLFKRGLEEYTIELRAALNAYIMNPCEETKRSAIDECRDGSNFLMMIADNLETGNVHWEGGLIKLEDILCEDN